MNRPHFLVILLLAFLIVLVTFFLPPFSLFSTSQEISSGVEHGWPVAWASTPLYAEIPVIGPLLFWLTPSSITFHLYGFLFDMGFWFSILWLVVVSSRRSERGT